MFAAQHKSLSLQKRYDLWARRFRFWYAWLAEKIARYTEATRILDVGCGSGLMMEELRRVFPNAEVVGVDRDAVMCSIAKALRGDAKKLPFKSGVFDLVVFAYSLHETGLCAIYEAKRVMSRGGIIVVRDIDIEMPQPLKAFLLANIETHIGRDYVARVARIFETFPPPSFVLKFISDTFKVEEFSRHAFDFDIIARKC